MKLTLMVVGNTDDEGLKAPIEKYVSRLKHYGNFVIEVVEPPKSFKKLPTNELKVAEGRLILNQVTEQDMLIILDENGTEYNSVGFSEKLQKWLNGGQKRMVFLIGGAFGFSDELYQRANHKLALSKMTLTHQMVRLFFVEQLYRAFTILKNEKYHH